MAWKLEAVQSPLLRPATSNDHFNLHVAALEWSLAEPIIINSAEDIKSRVEWRDRVEPYAHQVQNLISFCRRLPVTLLADDVGLGKTISAGLILSELMIRNRVKRALVVCPKILMPQWVEELETKFRIEARHATGEHLSEEIGRRTPVVITTYDSARDRIGRIPDGTFDMLILDEAHKLRNLYGGAGQPPKMATQIRSVLEKRAFKYVLMLTATPLQNRLWDLYSLIDCLTVAKGHKNPFGTPSEFSARYISDASKGARNLKHGRDFEFRNILSQYIARTRRGDAKLQFPERKVHSWPVQPTKPEWQLFELLGEHIANLGALEQTSISQALFSSPSAFVVQLGHMADKKTIPRYVVERAQTIAASIPIPAKLGGLSHAISQLRQQRPDDWRVVVFTTRRETQISIGKYLEAQKIRFGFIRGGSPRENDAAIRGFKQDPPLNNVIVSTDAGAEGVNLQAANVLVNYDLPWNPMIVEQRIGRIQRLASKFQSVHVVNLIAAGTVEDRVVGRLIEKLQLAAHAIGDIEAILDSVGGEDGEESLESEIREMVVQSLIGQDVERAARLAQESIEQARSMIEEQREEIDQRLGQLDAIHKTGPIMPKLGRAVPRMPLHEFVLSALRAEGSQIHPKDNSVYEVRPRNGPREYMTFDEKASIDEHPVVFGGNPPKLYKQGKPAFERLAQSWCEKHAHFVTDLTKPLQDQFEKIGLNWCTTISRCQFDRAELLEARTAFQGTVLCKAKAAVAHDSYEKLIEAKHIPEGHRKIVLANDSAPIGREVIANELAGTQTLSFAAEAVERDSDIGEFRKFYEARLLEEVERAGKDERLRSKCRSDFTPLVYAETVGITGIAYCTSRIRIFFALDENAGYSDEIEAVPSTGQILKQPEFATCEFTGARVPVSCFGTCCISNKRVLRHLLVSSDATQRMALPEFQKVCDITGKRLLRDEIGSSDVSGKSAGLSLLYASPISGRKGLSDEFEDCEFSRTRVLRDEIRVSQVSGKMYRCDQESLGASTGVRGHRSEFVTCAISGKLLLPNEAGRSDLTGKTVWIGLLLVSEKTGRHGTQSDTVTCDVSKKRLLRDEVGQSVVSNKVVDIELLAPSALSKQVALKTELVRCDETGLLLLPAEVRRCVVTGKVVDKRLTGKSEVSGQRALLDRLIRCAKTSKLALPSELRTCEITKLRVLPDVLRKCCVTGQMVCIDRLVRSAASNQYMLPEHSVQSIESRLICGKHEAVDCAWQEGPILPSESGVCLLTGLTFSRTMLNEVSEFQVMRSLLNGCEAGSDVPGFWTR